MNCFTKAADEFAHQNFLVKSWLKPNAPAYPDEKNRERGNPRPPTGPGALLQLRVGRLTGVNAPGYSSASPAPALKGSDARQQKSIHDRTFDQHRRGEQNKVVHLTAQFPSVFLPDPSPDPPAD